MTFRRAARLQYQYCQIVPILELQYVYIYHNRDFYRVPVELVEAKIVATFVACCCVFKPEEFL